ncbi:hypothetical protein GUJ93_ZPchr0006g43152 [Zizania palustris]|nr:hypothetical protein GUJ93_ZPchr0006g43152 [Zizania palustris]
MGKYMRKCKGATGEEVAAMEVTQVVGVRTRSRSASVAAGTTATQGAVVAKVQASSNRRRKALLLPPAAGDSAVGTRHDSGSCYLQLRSRLLFKAPPRAPAARADLVGAAAGAGNGAAHAAGLSGCSSTASSVDMAARDRSLACRSEVAEAGSEHVSEGSAGGRDRERRETTPSSFLLGEMSDLESDLAGQKRRRLLPSATATAQEATRPLMPPAAEIEEFFATAEKAEAKRFAAK